MPLNPFAVLEALPLAATMLETEDRQRYHVEGVDPEDLRTSFRAFIPEAWAVIEPEPFKPGWHLDAIAEHLEAVTAGAIRNLLVNLPPRHSKSTLVSVLWPVWEWLTRPQERYLTASYAQSLAIRDALKSRRLIQSGWFRRRWGDLSRAPVFRLTGDMNTKSRYDNSAGGFRIASSVDGSNTGEGGSRIVIDDPHNAKESLSDVSRLAVIDWWDRVMSTRRNDPERSARIVIAQRLHERDLPGHILAKGGDWTHLRLPAEYDGKRFMTTIGWTDPRKNLGDLLWPQQYDRPALEELKRDLGPSNVPGQLQQTPSPPGGAVVKRKYLRYWQPADQDLGPVEWIDDDGQVRKALVVPLPSRFDEQAQSWDCTFKESKTADFVVGTVWGRLKADKYLLDCSRDRRDIVATLQEIKALTRRWPLARLKIIEEKANGAAVIRILHDSVPGLIAFNPDKYGDKLARLNACLPDIEAGNVYLPHPRLASWVAVFVDELLKFPNDEHDDQVDSMTQMLIRWARRHGGAV